MKISLVFLTLNEIQGLRALFDRIPLGAVDEVLAIDGGSTDGTVDFLKEKGIAVYPQSVRGRGEAFREAFRRATGDALIFYSPDGNEDPADIPRFRPLLESGSDLVIATRMVRGARNEEDGHWFRPRKWANLAFTAIANLAWNRGKWVTDTINGFRAVTRRAWETIALDGPGYTIEYQSSIRAFKSKLRISEFPTHEASRVDERVGSPSIPTGLAFLRLFFRELLVGKRHDASPAGAAPWRVRSRRLFAAAAVLYLCFAALTQFSRRPALHPESVGYLVGFLRPDKNVVEKVFDVRTNDTYFRAREASSILDLLDAQLTLAWHRIGIPHFFSSVHLLLSALFALSLFYFGWRRGGRWGAPLGFLLGLWFLSMPSTAIQTWFRSAKIGSGVLASVIILAWFLMQREARPLRLRTAFLWVFPALFLGLLDEQGFFWSGVIGALFLSTALVDSRRSWFALSGMVWTVCLSFRTIYLKWLGPWIIEQLNGYVPTAQIHAKWGQVAGRPIRVLAEGVAGTLGLMHPMFGGQTWVVLFALGILITGLWMRGVAPYPSAPKMRRTLAGLIPLGLLTGVLLLQSLIAGTWGELGPLRELLRLEVWHSIGFNWGDFAYYPIPAVCVLTVLCAAALIEWIERRPSAGRAAMWALACLVLLNLNSIPRMQRLMNHPSHLEMYQNASEFFRARREHSEPPAGLKTLFDRLTSSAPDAPR